MRSYTALNDMIMVKTNLKECGRKQSSILRYSSSICLGRKTNATPK